MLERLSARARTIGAVAERRAVARVTDAARAALGEAAVRVEGDEIVIYSADRQARWIGGLVR
ncbi:hypothetical protein GO308_11665 [Sphingomonas sp. SFZ2018-12]|uniref:hypothetical protein n=1 Tax=Sphingomonas sp. SFZ2018-12 TaxID=2683197 RepID=UPI001F102FF1|nr:hypothetical protein [Sphingomonas sp. SFZ2018-12]MCH4893769.1 hypothetical protein [Sphingomonas sp. SFZ2018-12]